jgi:hypothetical protein
MKTITLVDEQIDSIIIQEMIALKAMLQDDSWESSDEDRRKDLEAAQRVLSLYSPFGYLA